MTDIVLNHTSSDNPLLSDKPEISFNNINTPQLLPAIELDRIIQEVNEELEREQFVIMNEEDLVNIRERLDHKLQEIRFQEYWMISLDGVVHSLSSHFVILSTEEDEKVDENFFNIFCGCLVEEKVGHRFSLSIHSRSHHISNI